MAKKHEGIRARHARSCASRAGTKTCNCTPSYEAWCWSKRDGRKIRRTFHNVSEAKNWRADASGAVRKGSMRSPTQTTLREAATAWLAGAKDGTVRTRSGDVFKPSTVRSYATALNRRVLDEFGALRLSEPTRVDVQDFADKLLSEGLDASSIRNTLMPLRAIYGRAMSRGEVTVNPTSGVKLPAVRGKRDRIASPTEAAALLEALPDRERGLWACAMYGGLRRGELMAIRWEDVDLPGGKIRVERSWDVQAGVVDPKSRAGRRTVPIASVLREHLAAHKLRCAWSAQPEGLVFGRSATVPFEPGMVNVRAQAAWSKANTKALEEERTPMQPLTLHECRHSFASLMIAAGVNAKALSTYMGHSSVTITYDRYGHLMPGNEAQAAGLLDAYLTQAKEATK